MSTDEYVPSEDDVRIEYVLAHQGLEAQLDAGEAYDRWLAAHDARVRRDAAREALDGLARQEETHCEEQKLDPHGYHIHFLIADAATAYRDTHYPEERG